MKPNVIDDTHLHGLKEKIENLKLSLVYMVMFYRISSFTQKSVIKHLTLYLNLAFRELWGFKKMLNRCNKRKSKEDYMRIALGGLRSFSRSIMKYALIYEVK